MRQWLTQMWYREPTGGSSALQPLACLYGAVVNVRRRAYESGWFRTYRVDCPVLVVGNLTVGGTGKTPLVAWLATQLKGAGLEVGIASRGYGSNAAEPRIVNADSNSREVGDEPLLLRRRTGCLTAVGPDRVAVARLLVERGAQVIIADDGLQHLRLARDCEIVVVDGARGFGNGRLLPAGPLREPASRAGRADVVVVNGAAEHASLRAPAGAPVAGTALRMDLVLGDARPVDGREESRPLESFRDGPVHAVAGIGHPARFFRELRALGLQIMEHAFADHHPFTPRDLQFGDDRPVLMTEKDAVKCRQFADARLWYVPVTACFSEAHARELLDRVSRRLGLSLPPRG